MAIVDIIALVLIVLYFIKGYRTGFVLSLIKVIAIILGIIIAMHFSAWLSSILFKHPEGALSNIFPLLSYAILFTVVVIGVNFLGRSIQRMVSVPVVGLVNRIMGGLIYTLVTTIVISTFFWLGDKVHIISDKVKQESLSYRYTHSLAPAAFEYIGILLPFAKDTFNNLDAFFEKAAHNMSS